MVASNGHLPVENLRLISRGNVLHDTKDGDDIFLQLNDGGKIWIQAIIFFDDQHLQVQHNIYISCGIGNLSKIFFLNSVNVVHFEVLVELEIAILKKKNARTHRRK